MEIVNSQVHIAPHDLPHLVASMDALGIAAAVLDEYWGPKAVRRGVPLPGGGRRASSPTAEIAATLHPGRFAYLQRADVDDPDAVAVVRLLGQTPGAVAVRLPPGMTRTGLRQFQSGEFRPIVAAAVDAGLAIFVFIQGAVELLAPYLEEFRAGRFIIDHCGMPIEAYHNVEGPERPALDSGPGYAYFDRVLAMAEHPNVALKWSHPQGVFGVEDFPYAGLDGFLRRALGAFGAERVMWASDASVIRGHCWGELLYSLRANPNFSEAEKAWLLGGSVRGWLRWPAAAPG